MKWTTDTKELSGFWASAARMGYDRDAVHEHFKVSSIEELACEKGQALSELLKASEAKKNSAIVPSGGSNLVRLSEEQLQALYPTEGLYIYGLMVHQFAPWAQNKKYPVTQRDVALAVLYCDALGVDALNPHEMNIYKDKWGIHFMLAYTLQAQWATEIHGGHRKPHYHILTADEKEEQGIKSSDYAVRCQAVLRQDRADYIELIKAGMSPQDVRDEIAYEGIGTAKASDYNEQYFAPAGRSKMWKLEKRSLTDLYRRLWGTPSRKDIMQMRRSRGDDNLKKEDWIQVTPGSNSEVALLEAKHNAAHRERGLLPPGDGEKAIAELYDLEGPGDEVGDDPYDMSYLDEPSAPLEKPEWGKVAEVLPVTDETGDFVVEEPPHWSLEPGKYDSFYAWADAELGSREAVIEALKDKDGNERDLIDIAAAPTAQWYVTRALEK